MSVTVPAAPARPAPPAALASSLPVILRSIEERGLAFEELTFAPLTADGRTGVGIHRLYTTEETGDGGPAAGIVRYEPGAATVPHRHQGYEIIYVFEGQLETEAGAHPAGSMLVMSPGSVHAPRSADGAVLLVVWEQPVLPLR
ncbi:cupin domain-containing protein [Streptomyces sp. ET3-23]|uniref:cupin domain-containing protein n=1 Tax=Streptomyces sp. ET3-23 TaxID=2885643 RepID=UPI001D12C3EF|nr:cupin domain-containing protein [Streptomyces sp. ET3-23]MCC2274682.1 cupin domain-containing protein [Streptomyces sp. ET3-23]